MKRFIVIYDDGAGQACALTGTNGKILMFNSEEDADQRIQIHLNNKNCRGWTIVPWNYCW